MKLEHTILLTIAAIVGVHMFLTYCYSEKDDTNNTNDTNDGSLVNKVKNVVNKLDLGKFPRPQPSLGYLQLSTDKKDNPLYKRNIANVKDNKVKIIRSSNLENDNNPIYYKPDYYKSDFISPNPIGSTEFSEASFDSVNTTVNAWSDKNISQHPSFYRSEIKDEKTNVGRFFDKNNMFHDKTSVYSTNNLPDRCFLDKDNNVRCNFNDRLQNIPPSLIDNKVKNDVLNKISGSNITKDVKDINVDSINGNSYSTFVYNNEKVMNGGDVYKGVSGSYSSNENYLNLNSIDNVKNVAI